MLRFLHVSFFVIGFLSMHHISAQCWPGETFANAGEFTYTIPGNPGELFEIGISADGADGGDFLWGSNPSSAGGGGAAIIGNFVVSAGDQLLIIVGESGFDALGSPGGGGGGGGTAVIINGTDVLIAAGAGGGGGQNILGQGGQANTNSPAQGGGGPGASGGGGFNQAGQNGQAGTGGGAGTLTGQGLGGTQGVVAGPGGNGFGGGGGGAGTTGGGGGGYQGGDGASNGSLNGKGGNSYVNPGFSSQVIGASAGMTGGGNNRDGLVGIECLGLVTNTLVISVLSQDDPTCAGAFDGQITVEASMGTAPYMYSLDGGAPQTSGTFSGLGPGTYVITAVDNTGAMISTSVTLTDPPMLELTYVDQQDVLCFGDMTGTITVTASGGTPFPSGDYNFYVNNVFAGNSGMITGLAQGTYDILLEDSNDCTDQLTVDILSNDEIVITTVQAVDVSCQGGSDGIIEVDATGGFGAFTYSLNGLGNQPSGLYTNLTAGTYSIVVTDGDGCTAMTTISIDEPTELVATASAVQPSCSNPTGSATITAMGGTMPYEYSIDGMTYQPNNTFTGLAPGSYTIDVIDANNCTTMTSVMINTFSSITLMSTGQDLTCNSTNGSADGSITLQVSGGVTPYTFAWTTMNGSQLTPNQQDQMGLSAGTYSVVVSDQDGCTESATVTLSEPDAIEFASQTTDVTCNGGADGTIDITNLTGGTSPYVLDWTTTDGSGLQSGATMQTGLTAGTYGLIVTDSNGCSSMESFSLSSAGAITITTSVTDASCTAGGSVTIVADGGTAPYTYAIDGTTFGSSPSFSDLAAGNYMATVMDADGCTMMASFNIQGSADAITISDVVRNPDCHANNGSPTGDITLTVSGGDGNYTYAWTGPGTSGSADNQSNLGAGTYTVMVSDGTGCSAMATYTLTEPQEIAFILNSAGVSCNGGTDGMVGVEDVTGGTSPYTYAWTFNNSGLANTEAMLSDVQAGTYGVEVVDANGCISSQTAEVTEPPALALTVDATQAGDQWTVDVTGDGGVPPYEYAVDDVTNASDQTSFDLPQGSYTFYVIDANGCITTSTIMLGPTSTVDLADSRPLMMMPNPASGQVIISTGLASNASTTISVYSIDGQLRLEDQRFVDTTGNINQDISTLEPGLHLVMIKHGLETRIGKLIVL